MLAALLREYVRATDSESSQEAVAMSITPTKTAAAMVAEAKSRVENLPPARVASEIESGEALLVDVREADERVQNGVIKGAVHAPRGMIEFYADPTSPYHRPESSSTGASSSSAHPVAGRRSRPTHLRRSATAGLRT